MNYIQIKSELHFQLSNNQNIIVHLSVYFCLNEIENKNRRRYLTKFRISAHNLEIEMGRYKNKPRDERLCSGCKQLNINRDASLKIFLSSQVIKYMFFWSLFNFK
jgi:hypothetical protein